MGTKKFIKLFIPPLFIILIRSVIKKFLKPKPKLFDGIDSIFVNNITNKTIYGEYGCGLSTEYVLKNYSFPIYSVDSSKIWVNKFDKYQGKKNFKINSIELGEIGDWGYPINYKYRKNFKNYFNYIWEQKNKPNFILIDGRFRVACFFTTLLKADVGTKIVFDDYPHRKHYHIVEEFILPVSINDRQALFIVDEKVSLEFEKIKFELNQFTYVRD